MAVRYIELIESCEYGFDLSYIAFTANYPQDLSNSVISYKVILRGMSLGVSVYEILEFIVLPAEQEYRLRICLAGIEMVYPVCFLVYSGELMLLDLSVPVVIYGSASYDPALSSSIHYLPVYIV